jgi:hypothetical protein
MTRWSAITWTRRSCSALAYGSRSTAAAEKTSSRSHTTSGDATPRPSPKNLDPPRETLNLSPKPVPKKVIFDVASKLIRGPHIWRFMPRAVTDVTFRVRATLVLAKRYREALVADGSAHDRD